jgi:hypothetical protein
VSIARKKANMRRFSSRVLPLALAALIAGCGGGGGASLQTVKSPVNAPSPASSGSSPTTLSISVHPQVTAASRARHVAYVVPTVQSVTLQAIRVNGVAVSGQPVYEQDLTRTSTGCTGSGASVTCSSSVSAPNGTVLFAVKSYAATGAVGSPTSTSYALATISPSGANRVTLSAGATIAQVQLYLATPNFTPGTAATSLLVVVPLDANGNVIVATGPYSAPIGLTLTATPAGHLVRREHRRDVGRDHGNRRRDAARDRVYDRIGVESAPQLDARLVVSREREPRVHRNRTDRNDHRLRRFAAVYADGRRQFGNGLDQRQHRDGRIDRLWVIAGRGQR